QVFHSSYFWKYVSAPWLGAALAVIGFAILRSTVAIFGGDVGTTPTNTPQYLANFGIGALAGYGAKDVFIWLDSKVSKLFAGQEAAPSGSGQSAGAEATTQTAIASGAGKVANPAPAASTPMGFVQSLDTVGTPSNGDKPVTAG